MMASSSNVHFGYYKGIGDEDFAGNDNNNSSSEDDNSESLAQLHQQYEQNQKQVALVNQAPDESQGVVDETQRNISLF